MSASTQISCSSCGVSFACDPAGDCWCKTPPYLPVPTAGATCLCPACLAKAQAAGRAKSDLPSAS